MNGIGWAIRQLRDGARIRRKGWNGKDMWLRLLLPVRLASEPEKNSSMTLPYIYIEYPKGHVAYPNGCRVPWLASQTDILALDWDLVE